MERLVVLVSVGSGDVSRVRDGTVGGGKGVKEWKRECEGVGK